MKRGVFIVALALCTSVGAEMRTWTLSNGRQHEAKFVRVMGDKVTLENSEGVVKKVRLDELSSEDRQFIELSSPPRLDLDFTRKTEKKMFSTRFILYLKPDVNFNTFGVRVKKTSAGSYSHELQVEFFAIGKERTGNRYQLLDRQSSSFIPTKENQGSHQFSGKTIELDDYVIDTIRGGMGYAGHLILVTDSRGELISTKASSKWLLENVENLKKLPVGSYMDKTCTRTFPSRPKSNHY
ncbi:MAG: hypothetical protein KAU94_04040 [Verrucomicrobia bacterium]|nr:hypothetical protein [Verrucomicrobiota bacterium]